MSYHITLFKTSQWLLLSQYGLQGHTWYNLHPPTPISIIITITSKTSAPTSFCQFIPPSHTDFLGILIPCLQVYFALKAATSAIPTLRHSLAQMSSYYRNFLIHPSIPCFLKKYLFIYLAILDLSCCMQYLHCSMQYLFRCCCGVWV